jgi:MoaA/NifB/PqqE/SkfB family radical SAM enzyme
VALMSKIRIVNWLLTRKCNLDCDYCAIVKNYNCMPVSYPPVKHYIKNEMTTDVVIKALRRFKMHNPDTFHILYGGEPLLRRDLPHIINYCNENKIYYTIISNNTPEIQPLIDRLFKETDYVEGFTSSVDPIFHHTGYANQDRIKKSIEGMKRLKEIQARGDVKDVVAEITVMNENKHLLYDLVAELSEHEIYSDVTFVDIRKNTSYDFSNVTEKSNLVYPTWDLANMMMKIMNDDSLLIHMKDILFPKMFDTLPSNFNCKLEDGIHNVTVDADGSMRLCLRIRGSLTPNIHVSELFEEPFGTLVTKDFYDLLCMDKRRLCQLCNHSCLMMSQYVDKNEEGANDLVHADKREDNIDG